MANSLGANTATATRPARTGRRSSNGRIATSNRPSHVEWTMQGEFNHGRIQHGEAAINVAQTSKAAVSPISNRQTVRGRTTRGLETRGKADLEIGATGAAPRRTIFAGHLLVGIFVVLNFCCVQQITLAGEGHWVTT